MQELACAGCRLADACGGDFGGNSGSFNLAQDARVEVAGVAQDRQMIGRRGDFLR